MAKGGAIIGFITGGLILVAVLVGGITAILVFSLIGLYPQNQSLQGSGSEYRVNALLLKGIYSNTTYSFFGGTVAESTQLSSLCTSVASSSISSTLDFTNCVVTSLSAYGRYNNSNTSRKRRRRLDEAGVYLAGKMRLFFSTSCEKVSDRSQYSNGSNLGGCTRQRLSSCNTFINQSAFQSWTPFPSGLVLEAVDNTSSGYQALSLDRIFLVPSYMAQTYAGFLNFSTSFYNYFSLGCQYIAPISLSDISGIVSSQSSATTTAPTNTSSG